MQPQSSTDALVVLMPGTDARLLGVSSRTRNARVAARAGAHVIDAINAIDATHAIDAVDAADAIGATHANRTTDATDAETRRLEHRPAILVPADLLIDFAQLPVPSSTGPTRLAADGDLVFDIATASARRRAAWTILRRSGKRTDGVIARRFNRPISRVVSFALLSMGLTASHASILTLAVGLLGAAVSAQPGYVGLVAAAVFFQLASVLDGVDGEMARATLTESDAGARLDTIVDHVTYVAFFVGVTIGWAREGGSTGVLLCTVAIAVGLVLSLFRGARFVAEHAPDASFVFIDRSVRRAAQDSGQMVLRTAAHLFALLRRDVFAVVFFVAALTGRRELVPGLVAFGVLLANLTLSIYDRELAAAAAAERLASR